MIEENKFKLPEIDWEEIGRDGTTYLEVQVDGFYSKNITLQINRGWRSDSDWTVSISHSSSGGESPGVDVLEARWNFAKALLATVTLAEEIRRKISVLEENYQDQKTEQRMQWEADAAERKLREESDPELGPDRALFYLNKVIEEVKQAEHPLTEAYVRVKRRGTRVTKELRARRYYDGKIRLMFGGENVTRKVAIERLADMYAEEVEIRGPVRWYM